MRGDAWGMMTVAPCQDPLRYHRIELREHTVEGTRTLREHYENIVSCVCIPRSLSRHASARVSNSQDVGEPVGGAERSEGDDGV